MRTSLQRNRVALAVVLAALLAAGSVAHAQTPSRTVQPGAPGEPSRALDAAELTALTGPGHTAADVQFMQGMILHHAQALEMTALVPERSQRDDVRLLARRIEASQEAEIELMRNWLAARHEAVPHPNTSPRPDHHHHDHHHDHPDGDHRHDALMPGMLTEEQMTALAQSSGEAFDRLFLELMILHHRGALSMVDELFSHDGAGQDSTLFQFASHVDSDQRVEIDRMQAMLRTIPQPDTE